MILPALMIGLWIATAQQVPTAQQGMAVPPAPWLAADRMRRADAAAAADIPKVVAEAPEKGVVGPRTLYMPSLSDLYPPSALRAEQQGLVLLRCTLSLSGTLAACALLRSSEVAALDAAAFEVARYARYSPKIVDRTPEASIVALPVRWVIAD